MNLNFCNLQMNAGLIPDYKWKNEVSLFFCFSRMIFAIIQNFWKRVFIHFQLEVGPKKIEKNLKLAFPRLLRNKREVFFCLI